MKDSDTGTVGERLLGSALEDAGAGWDAVGEPEPFMP